MEKMTTKEVFEVIKSDDESKKEELIQNILEMFSSKIDKELIENMKIFADILEKTIDMTEEEIENYINDLVNEDKEIIENLHYTKPQNLVQSLTKIMKYSFDGKTDLTEPTEIIIGKKDEVVNVQLFVSVLDNNGKLIPKNLTPYDNEVFNGVCSILETGQNIMTPNQIYEAMTGKTPKNPQQRGAITKSMRKLQTTLLSLDWTEHAKMRRLNIKENECIITEEPVILAKRCYIKSYDRKGEEIEIDAYKILEMPSLLRYAKSVGQISTTPKEVLCIDTISNTEENIVLKNYLIREVEHMKKNPKWNNILTFENIFNTCGIKVSKQTSKRKREVIFAILDYWKKIKYIKNYEVMKEGRTYKKIKIKA